MSFNDVRLFLARVVEMLRLFFVSLCDVLLEELDEQSRDVRADWRNGLEQR